MTQLDKEKKQLKQQLQTFLINARENEEKLKRFEQVEFKLMEANTLVELLDILLLEYPSLFNVSFSTLIFIDAQKSISQLLPEHIIKKQYLSQVSLLSFTSSIKKITPLTKNLFLGDYNNKTHQQLIHKNIQKQHHIQSIAIIPLIRHKHIIGIFSCVSEQKNRFEPNSGTDFMKRLGYIISVCIENVLNYEKLKLCSLTDPLTGIKNRRFFDQSLQEEVTRVHRSKLPLSCLLIDIDHFKKVNDSYGHSAGDEVLIEVVKRIQETLRSQEILARYGGEEFILLLPETENKQAFHVAQRILMEVNKKVITFDTNQSITVTVSIGLSTLKKEIYSKDIPSFCNDLVEQSDQALYQAKESGRNKVCNNGFC